MQVFHRQGDSSVWLCNFLKKFFYLSALAALSFLSASQKLLSEKLEILSSDIKLFQYYKCQRYTHCQQLTYYANIYLSNFVQRSAKYASLYLLEISLVRDKSIYIIFIKVIQNLSFSSKVEAVLNIMYLM